jgi:two-component system response regulator HupR/HoxA
MSVDVRVVAATHHDLEADVRAGTFREDLYYRLATVTLHVPALRERAMDIPLLAGRLLEASQKALGKSGRRLQHRGARLSRRLPLAGQRARAAERDPAHAGALRFAAPRCRPAGATHPAHAGGRSAADNLLDLIAVDGGLKERIEALEARVLKETLIRHRWNKSRAASELGLSRVGLRNKLLRYGLERG